MKSIRLLLLASLLIAGSAQAAIILDVSLNTATISIPGNPPGPLSLAFQLADGSGTGNGNNSAILSNFQFGGGGPTGLPFLMDGASGDLSSSVVLTDSGFANVFIQGFTPGTTLQFRITLTTNLESGAPDTFLWSILDNTGFPLPTTSVSPLYPLLVIDIDSSSPTIATFGSDASILPNAGGFSNFPAPAVTEVRDTSTVPEPSTGALVSIALVGLGWAVRRRTKQ